MVTHIVLLRFSSEVSAAEINEIWAELDGLRKIVEGLESAVFGGNVSPEALARGYTHGFVMTFCDAAARDAYLEHPAHKAAGARLVAALEGGLDGLLVIDL